MIQRGCFRFFLRAGPAARHDATALGGLWHVTAEQSQSFRTRLFQADIRIGEHLRRDALLLAQQPQQQMLGADVGVVQLARFAHGEFEHLLGT